MFSVAIKQSVCLSLSVFVCLCTGIDAFLPPKIQVRVFRPPNYTVPIIILLALGAIGLLAYFTRIDLSFLYNTANWGYAALVCILEVQYEQIESCVVCLVHYPCYEFWSDVEPDQRASIVP